MDARGVSGLSAILATASVSSFSNVKLRKYFRYLYIVPAYMPEYG